MKKLKDVLSMMKQRCNNPNNKDYYRYGNKGIKVCDEWNNTDNFIDWALENGYKDGLEIERKDNNEGYNPNNCIFADRFTQNQNKKTYKNNVSNFAGIGITKSNTYRVRLQAFKKSFYLGCFKDINEAIKTRDEFILNNKFKHTLNGVKI